MLVFEGALALPFASTVAMSPPQVMIGTCVGPGATAPTGVVTVCASGGDWMNCPCAIARAPRQARPAAAAKRDRAIMTSLRDQPFTSFPFRMNTLSFLPALILLPGIANVHQE